MLNTPRRQFSRNSIVYLCVLLYSLLSAVSASNVLLITIDGLRHDVLTNLSSYPTLRVPTLTALVADGTLYAGSRSVFPASTYPSHTSMVTGVNPSTHGILTNSRFDPQAQNSEANWFYNYIQAPTIWDAASKAGLHVASISWPVTTGSPATLIMQDAWADTPSDTDYLYNSIRGDFASVFPSPSDLHERMAVNYSTADKSRCELAVSFVKQDPELSLIAVHFTDLDSVQHAHGVFPGQEAWAALERIDSYIGQLIQVMNDTKKLSDTTIVIGSDHGFVNLTSAINIAGLLESFGLAGPSALSPLPWTVYPDCSGGLCGLYTNPQMSASAKTVLDSVIQLLSGQPDTYHIAKVYSAAQASALKGFAKAYAVLEAVEGYTFLGAKAGSGQPYFHTSPEAGGHGYSPDLVDMHGTLVLSGYQVKSGQVLPNASVIDIGPTVAYLLGLDLGPQVEGQVLKDALSDNPPRASRGELYKRVRRVPSRVGRKKGAMGAVRRLAKIKQRNTGHAK